MTTSDALVSRHLEALRTAVTGGVFVPGQDGYDQARQAWNLAVDERPAVVVIAESPADVARAVRFARSREMRIAPQRPGHPHSPRRSRRPVAGRDGARRRAWPGRARGHLTERRRNRLHPRRRDRL